MPSVQSLLEALRSALAPGPESHDQTIGGIERQIDFLQTEITSLQDEVNLLRRRDESLGFYMNRVDEEMRLAARLQQDFLPKSMPQLGQVRFHSLYRPAGYVSGDLYDIMRLDENHVGFYMADAVGHGMPAALLTMFIKNALVTKEIVPGGYRLLPPGEVLAKLNQTIVEQNLSYATFATAIYGYINVHTLEIQFARGGHPNPVLIRPDGSTQDLAAEGSLLGVFSDGEFQSASFQLAPGERLLLYTDGVEVLCGSGEKLDINRWRDELKKRSQYPTEQLLQEFSQQLDASAGSLQPKDDLTMVMLETTADTK
ncbi:MAG TPA: SpoIIE family protein phosphatase [Tepidisphaeraceae bacterium]|nr:SpoIIE family protein phosphatase [Tepidisphaeraceae bacterium]